MDSLDRYKQLKHDAEEQKYQHLLAPIITPADLLALLAVAEELQLLLTLAEEARDNWRENTYSHLAKVEEQQKEIARSESSRKHTQKWYASHYGKLEDWARKRLPDPWRNEFFSCIANGTYSHKDVGEAYICKAGFKVVPSGYIHMDDAKGQLILDQTTRAEAAEAKLSAMEEVVEAGRKLAENQKMDAVADDEYYCGWCGESFPHPEGGMDGEGNPCPVGIVLGFTKNREAER